MHAIPLTCELCQARRATAAPPAGSAAAAEHPSPVPAQHRGRPAGVLGCGALHLHAPPEQRRLRILCLHGFRQTGGQLRGRWAGLARRLSDLAVFTFIDGPHVLPNYYRLSRDQGAVALAPDVDAPHVPSVCNPDPHRPHAESDACVAAVPGTPAGCSGSCAVAARPHDAAGNGCCAGASAGGDCGSAGAARLSSSCGPCAVCREASSKARSSLPSPAGSQSAAARTGASTGASSSFASPAGSQGAAACTGASSLILSPAEAGGAAGPPAARPKRAWLIEPALHCGDVDGARGDGEEPNAGVLGSMSWGRRHLAHGEGEAQEAGLDASRWRPASKGTGGRALVRGSGGEGNAGVRMSEQADPAPASLDGQHLEGGIREWEEAGLGASGWQPAPAGLDAQQYLRQAGGWQASLAVLWRALRGGEGPFDGVMGFSQVHLPLSSNNHLLNIRSLAHIFLCGVRCPSTGMGVLQALHAAQACLQI